jgi:phospholipid/cholesterol/gamma-HCH transport system substrate-binding protein
MANQGENNINLGAFVLAGLMALILAFYMIGKNHNMFGSNFVIKARFSNLNGLVEGNNVLFSGIQAGTVKSVSLINDTTIEVTLLIDNKIRSYIHKNATASIINIIPSPGASPVVEEGDLLVSQKIINTDEMLQTLSKTNKNIAGISEELKVTVLRINKSALLDLLNDSSIGKSLKSSLLHINQTTANASKMSNSLNVLVAQIKAGKGGAGVLLADTGFAKNLQEAMVKIRLAGENADKLVAQLNKDFAQGKGPLNTLLRDSVTARNISLSLENIQKGTDGFNQNMEALKHNFLFRGYFKNLEKAKKKKGSSN